MAEGREVRVKVVSQRGHCEYGHREGDEWVVGDTTPAGLCTWAFNSLYPALSVLMYGGAFPWESDPDACTVCCPDPANPVVFELRRLPE